MMLQHYQHAEPAGVPTRIRRWGSSDERSRGVLITAGRRCWLGYRTGTVR